MRLQRNAVILMSSVVCIAAFQNCGPSFEYAAVPLRTPASVASTSVPTTAADLGTANIPQVSAKDLSNSSQSMQIGNMNYLVPSAPLGTPVSSNTNSAPDSLVCDWTYYQGPFKNSILYNTGTMEAFTNSGYQLRRYNPSVSNNLIYQDGLVTIIASGSTVGVRTGLKPAYADGTYETPAYAYYSVNVQVPEFQTMQGASALSIPVGGMKLSPDSRLALASSSKPL